MMNKLAVVISAVLVVGLAGCTEDAAKKKCSADCNGRLTTTWCPNHGDQYTGGTMGCNTTTCTLDDSLCETGTTVGEFEECTGTGQGDCMDGLDCRGICWTECDPRAATDPCGTDRRCVLVSNTDETDGVCVSVTAQRDQECLLNGHECSTGVCRQTVSSDDPNGPAFHCKVECPEAELETQGSCAASELCLDSGWIDQLDPDETCSNPGTVDTCSRGSCYDGWNDQAVRCGEIRGYCGTVEPLLGGFSDADIDDYFAGDPDGCNEIDDHQMCSIQNATGEPASALCVDVLGDTAGNLYAACIAVCEQEDGPDLDCGDDGAGNQFNCAVPPNDEAFYFELAGGEDCADDTPCDTTAGYHCDGPFGDGSSFFCARPLKMCMTP